MIYKNEKIYVEVHESEIPWLKIFSVIPYKELSECDSETKRMLFSAMESIEKEMIRYYNPTKINIASFGNYLPHLHIHVMARFAEDSYFPESMWGVKQREGKLTLASFEIFAQNIKTLLEESFHIPSL